MIDNAALERVDKLMYLGSYVHENWDPAIEVTIRFKKAKVKSAFIKLRKAICSHELSLHLRIRMVKSSLSCFMAQNPGRSPRQRCNLWRHLRCGCIEIY